ncbi:MAG: HAMP domain-containing sensor histidine kinase [Dyella sp.]
MVFAAGAYRRRLALVFGLQLAAVAITCLMGIYNVAPLAAVLALIVITSVLAWFAALREWRPISELAKIVNGWNEEAPDLDSLLPDHLPRRTDADIATLARGLHHLASRIQGYSERERSFTRDASHELRSPLTVIKMSNEMLADEPQMSAFGQRSVRRIRRAAREMEVLVEAMLILARESDNGLGEQNFVVNDVLQNELVYAREVLEGRPIELLLEEPSRFAVHASPRVFAVLCWQLIRNACQQTDQGTIVITVAPGMVTVVNRVQPEQAAGQPDAPRVDRHGFELAIAQRISERFDWPLELQTREGEENIARLRFPGALPA